MLFSLYGCTWILKLGGVLGISLAVSRFIAGLGFPLIWATFCVYVLKHVPKLKGTFLFKGTKKEVNRLIFVLNMGAILLFVGLFIWQLMILFSWTSYLFGRTAGTANTWLRSAPSIGGIFYFMVGTYIIPTWKEEPYAPEEEGLLDTLKEKFHTVGRKLKKGYWKYLRRDFLKAHLLEYVWFRGRFDEQRTKLSWLAILPLALGLINLPILSVPAIFIWFRTVYAKNVKTSYLRIEKLLLIIFLGVNAFYLSLLLSPVLQEFIVFPSLARRILWTFPYIGGNIAGFYLFSQSTLWQQLPIHDLRKNKK